MYLKILKPIGLLSTLINLASRFFITFYSFFAFFFIIKRNRAHFKKINIYSVKTENF